MPKINFSETRSKEVGIVVLWIPSEKEVSERGKRAIKNGLSKQSFWW